MIYFLGDPYSIAKKNQKTYSFSAEAAIKEVAAVVLAVEVHVEVRTVKAAEEVEATTVVGALEEREATAEEAAAELKVTTVVEEVEATTILAALEVDDNSICNSGSTSYNSCSSDRKKATTEAAVGVETTTVPPAVEVSAITEVAALEVKATTVAAVGVNTQ